MRGKLLAIGIVVLGAGMAAAGIWMRGRGRPRLPLQPGAILLITVEEGGVALGVLAPGAVEFTRAHGVSSEAEATLAAIVTGRMPRESGLVRAGDAIARDLPVLGELLGEAGFAGAAFSARASPLFQSGVWRGCATVVEDAAEGGSDRACARAADWLLARGTEPSFCHLHLGRPAADHEPALASAVERLHAAGSGGRTVIVAASLADRAAPRLLLRLPPGLLRGGRDERDVSLLDVVPTLLELFGIPIRPGLMEPFLLAPRDRAPRFFLFTRPLAPPEEGCDAVRLLAGGRTYALDPAASPPENVADPALRDELRRILRAAFGYEVEEPGGGGAPRARFAGLPSPAR